MDSPPKRRHRLKLDLHADSLDDMVSAMEGVLHRIYEAENGRTLTVVTSGSPSAGFHLEHTVDESMTAERYRAELDAWLARDSEVPNG